MPNIGHSQYYIEGQVDANSKFRIAHLDILNTWDYFSSISDETIIKSVEINEDGSYYFDGYELSDKEGFYRIRYSKNKETLSINSLERNYINFIFSNQDTIKIFNTSLLSNNPQNRKLLKYIEVDDAYNFQQSSLKNKLNTSMHKTKHSEYCKNEIQQNNFGLTNLFLLFSSEMTMNDNPDLFKKVHAELLDPSFRQQYYNSMSQLIFAHDYKSLENKNKWLRNILIASTIVNFIFLIFFLVKRMSSTLSASKFIKPQLTKKEIEILQLIKAKNSNKEMASQLFVSEATIKTHINNIYRKLNVKSRQEAINSSEI